MSVDKNQAVIDFLMTSPQIVANPLYFNAINATDGSRELITQGNDINLNKHFVDGSVQKRYLFTLVDFRSVSYQALVNKQGYPGENVQELLDVQGLLDWINDQDDLMNYPNFGDNITIDEMKVLTNNPNLNGIDTSIKPALAKYSFTIQIDYIDKSKKIWK